MKKMVKTTIALGVIFLAMAITAAMLLSPTACDDKQSRDDDTAVTKTSQQSADQPEVGWGEAPPSPSPQEPTSPPRQRNYKVVHVIVALCDNEHQGIAKVPAALGNGQDPENNLYWGAMYGLRTFFRNSEHWEEIENRNIVHADSLFLRRSVFRAEVGGKPVYVVADAYDGAMMADTLQAFFDMAAGSLQQDIKVPTEETPIEAGGYADMICFVGHNGLMDVQLDNTPADARPDRSRTAVVLACKSADYFDAPLRKAGCQPLVMTYGNMAPEAYTLDAIIRSWAAGDSPAATRLKAAQAYAKYQKCSTAAAEKLFGAR